MNVLIPLVAGLILGYSLRRANLRVPNLSLAISVTVVVLVFLMGINAGRVKINAGWLTLSAVVFAILTSLGSLLLGLLVWRWVK